MTTIDGGRRNQNEMLSLWGLCPLRARWGKPPDPPHYALSTQHSAEGGAAFHDGCHDIEEVGTVDLLSVIGALTLGAIIISVSIRPAFGPTTPSSAASQRTAPEWSGNSSRVVPLCLVSLSRHRRHRKRSGFGRQLLPVLNGLVAPSDPRPWRFCAYRSS